MQCRSRYLFPFSAALCAHETECFCVNASGSGCSRLTAQFQLAARVRAVYCNRECIVVYGCVGLCVCVLCWSLIPILSLERARTQIYRSVLSPRTASTRACTSIYHTSCGENHYYTNVICVIILPSFKRTCVYCSIGDRSSN